jgi:Protein of unknown function (DUF3551)
VIKVTAAPALAIAALVGALFLAAPPSRAGTYGDAPWCVITSGGDEARWNCAYRTAQDCVQALAAVIRGSCNVNPAGGAATPSEGAPRLKRRR